MLCCCKGSTGCGKTTIVPLLLLLQHKNARLLIALPRRIAAQMAAERLRQLLGEKRLGRLLAFIKDLRERKTTKWQEALHEAWCRRFLAVELSRDERTHPEGFSACVALLLF